MLFFLVPRHDILAPSGVDPLDGEPLRILQIFGTLAAMSKTNQIAIRRKKKKGSPSHERRKANYIVRLTTPGRFCPDRLFCVLVYNDPSLTRSAASTSASELNWSLRSSLYDPDPAVLSGSIAGFAELANLYTRYKVHKMVARVDIINELPHGVFVGAWPSRVAQNVNSLTQDDLMEYFSNAGGKSVVVGKENGASVAGFSITADGASLVGPIFDTDLDYTSGVGTNPVEMFHINFGAVDPQGAFVYPLTVRCRVLYHAEFFDRRQLET